MDRVNFRRKNKKGGKSRKGDGLLKGGGWDPLMNYVKEGALLLVSKLHFEAPLSLFD